MSDSHVGWLCPLFAIMFNNVNKFFLVEVSSWMKAKQIQQPLVLFLTAEKSQAVMQLFEIMAIHHTFSLPVHQVKCCQVVLMGGAGGSHSCVFLMCDN